MDSYNVQWNKLKVSNKNIHDTQKMYFNKYLYRAEIKASGASFMRRYIQEESLNSFTRLLETRKSEISRNRYSFGHTYSMMLADAKQLWTINEAIVQNKGKVKIRIEDSRVQIYSETEEALLSFLSYSKKHITDFITTIHRPANDQSKTLLVEGSIIVKNPKYKFKITVRDRRYTAEMRGKIVEYFNRVKEDVYLTDGLVSRLKFNSTSPMWVTGYFYANDLNVVPFLQMISPTFVNKIYKIESAV